MGAGDVAMILGALVPTFLVSRLLLWLSKRWSGIGRLVLVHLVSAAAACVISALGHADGGSLDWSYSALYIIAQLIWFVVDLFRERRKAVQISN